MVDRIWEPIQGWAATTNRRKRRARMVLFLSMSVGLLGTSAFSYLHGRQHSSHFDGFLSCYVSLLAFLP